MGRKGWTRLAAVAAAVGLVPLLSGCVVFSLLSSGPQQDLIGDYQIKITACASGSAGCTQLGNAQVPALTGTGQILLAFRVQNNVTIPSSLTSTGPEALTFTQSPSYAAELERLSPAASGTHWIGLTSPVINYSMTSGPQSFTLEIAYKLGRGADGAPFQGPVAGEIYVGTRLVTDAFPGTRPVVCGPSLTALYDEVPPPSMGTDIWVICADSTFGFAAVTRDLGVLSGASGSGPPGGLASLAFSVRYNGFVTNQANFRLNATTTLPGASVAVTPEALTPPTNSTTTAVAAVGIPAGARPGTYDVTLSAKLANGQARAAVGKLTVLPGASGGSGPAARLRLTTILPRRLSAKAARRRGIAVLIGANKGGTARVLLFQGRSKVPKASKRVRLRVPGPTKVVLKSARLRKGPYRIVIRVGGLSFVRRAVLAG